MILLTGASGNIGKRLSRKFIKEGIDFIGIDCVSNPELPEDKFKKMDIRDSSVGKLIGEKGIDSVIHMAFTTNPKMNPKTRFDIDINGSKNIAECSVKNGLASIVFISSGRVYGNPSEKGGIYDKDGNYLNPANDFYANNKIKAENIFLEAASKNGIKLSILRLGIVCWPGGGKGMGNQIKVASKNGKFIRLSGKNPYIPLVHVNDVIDACINAIGKEGIFDIIGEEKMTLVDIYSEAARLGNKKASPIILPVKPVVAAVWFFWKIGLSPIPPLFVKMLGYDITKEISKTINSIGKPKYTMKQIINDIVNG